MKKFFLYFLIISSLVAFASCGDDDEETEDVWKEINDEAFRKISKDSEYTEIKSEANNGSVYYKVIKEGPETTADSLIYFSSRVKVYFKGSLYDGTVFDKRERDEQTPFYLAVNPAEVTQNSPFSSVIEGWSVALQHMKKGDHWEIWIPYQLGYGSQGYGGIKPYSTLVFEIEVEDVLNP